MQMHRHQTACELRPPTLSHTCQGVACCSMAEQATLYSTSRLPCNEATVKRLFVFRDEEDESKEGREEQEVSEEGEVMDLPDKQKTKGDMFFQLGDMDRFAEDAEQAAMRSDNDEDEEETGEQPTRTSCQRRTRILNMRLHSWVLSGCTGVSHTLLANHLRNG